MNEKTLLNNISYKKKVIGDDTDDDTTWYKWYYYIALVRYRFNPTGIFYDVCMIKEFWLESSLTLHYWHNCWYTLRTEKYRGFTIVHGDHRGIWVIYRGFPVKLPRYVKSHGMSTVFHGFSWYVFSITRYRKKITYQYRTVLLWDTVLPLFSRYVSTVFSVFSVDDVTLDLLEVFVLLKSNLIF